MPHHGREEVSGRNPRRRERSRSFSPRRRDEIPHKMIKKEKRSPPSHIQDRPRRDRDRHHEEVHRSRDRHDRPRHDRPVPHQHHPKIKREKPDKVDPKDKAKPDFGLSGNLAQDTNTFNGVVVKYNEPPEARVPKWKWRLYPFKGETNLPILHIHRQSAYLLGRERKVADIPLHHPSVSKQHAVLQFRRVPYERPDGTSGHRIRPYIIDLESANGTHINNKKIEAQRYVELQEKDVIKFGFSSREYVLLHDKLQGVSENPDDER